MAGRQAKILTAAALNRTLQLASRSNTPERDRVIVLLSVRAGLRACEIAGLDWSMVLDPRGRVGPAIEIPDAIAKKGAGRRVPVHPELRAALIDLRRIAVSAAGPVVASARGGRLRANSLVNWFVPTVVQAARVYGGTFRAPKPSFVATRGWNETTFAADDTYAAVRRLAEEHGAARGSSDADPGASAPEPIRNE